MHQSVDHRVIPVKPMDNAVKEACIAPFISSKDRVRNQIGHLQEAGRFRIGERWGISEVLDPSKFRLSCLSIFKQQRVQMTLVFGGIQNL